MLLGGVHDRQLAAAQGVALVREDLVHHLDHRVFVGDQQARLPVGREIHVALVQRLAEGAADGLFAEMLHVERSLALPLRHDHARIEGAQRHHVLEAGEQFVVRQQPGPGADRFAVAVQDADDRIGEIADLFRGDIDLRPRNGTGLRNLDVGKIRLATRPDRRFGDMQAKSIGIAHAVSGLPPECATRTSQHRGKRGVAS
ncbi:hypothetical protein D3C72_1561580 [compost metagenome]